MSEEASYFEASSKGGNDLFSVELAEVLRALRRRWWVIFGCTIIAGIVSYVVAARQLKIYRAVARVAIDPGVPKVLDDSFDVDNGASIASENQVFYNTQYDIMHSRSVMREGVARLKLADDRGFLEANGLGLLPPGEQRTNVVEEVLTGHVEVVPEHLSRIVKLVVEDTDPERAARIANTLTQVYIDQSLEGRLERTKSASTWLDERVDEFSKRLDSAEKQLLDFKRANMLVSISVEDRKNMAVTSLTGLNQKLTDVRARLIELESERQMLKDLNGEDELSLAPRVSKNEVVEKLRVALVELEQRQADLSSRYGERHPNMAAVQNQIERIRHLLQGEIKRGIAGLDSEIQELKVTEAAFRKEITSELEKAVALNNIGVDYNKLSREVKTNSRTYELLLKRQTEADLSSMLKSNFVHWLETAEPDPHAVRPSVRVNTVLGALLGMMLGLVIVIGALVLDNTIHNQEEVEDRLRVPFLGLLPSIEKKEKKGTDAPMPETLKARDLYILQNPKSSVAECARSLRTNLLFLGTEKPVKRLLITSSGLSEGKSTIVIALGTTMALAGNRVLLVDTDLRRPRLHKTFGASNDSGVTSALLNIDDLATAIKATEVPGLDILPCGPLPPNPSELLHTERFHKLLELLDERYDRVLLDSPPVHAVTDAAILSQIADGTILVVKANKTTREAARRAVRQLQNNLLGVILNNVNLHTDGYYKDHHYYHYYYEQTDEKAAEA